ncbi:hypothetical protein RHGRI_002788 [Rhododendron griersonianum]|uniref:LETM1-like protein n=1 Tax=Rhododendron griersonianum TaxID=479676 RepID=A0AAV6LQ85_9ERIC|nr:hypothetical protein RHGRI_002788 [Rhododendron griersonianum]KAG5567338.1 hypothetical protein RHGRI_002788 [Rhododendron griersonianum]
MALVTNLSYLIWCSHLHPKNNNHPSGFSRQTPGHDLQLNHRPLFTSSSSSADASFPPPPRRTWPSPPSTSLTCSAANRPSSPSSEISSSAKIRSEVLSPFRTVRMFFYLAFIASGSLGGLIATSQLIGALANSSRAAQVPDILMGLGIDVGAVSVFAFLYYRENSAKNIQLARLSREENLSNLKLRVSEKKVISVNDLRGIARLVILAGPASFISQCFMRSEPYTEGLLERGVLVVPFAIDGNSPSFEFDESEEMEEMTSRRKRLWQLVPVYTTEWSRWLDEQKKLANVSPESPVYLSLRIDGRVRGSGVGYPPWNAFVAQLPPVKGIWSGILDGMDGRVLSSNGLLSREPTRTCFSNKKVVYLDCLLFNWGHSKKRCRIKLSSSVHGNLNLSCRLLDFRKTRSTSYKSRGGHFLPFATAEDGVTVNGSPQSSRSRGVDETRAKLDQSLPSNDYSDGLVQLLHDAARVFELAIKEQISLLRISWFSTAWLGVDQNAWVKALSYQASVYALLQAASEISSRGDERDRDINVFVQRRSGNGSSFGPGNAKDITLIMLALSCIAAITKLGPTKVSCSQFFSMIPDITGRLMDMLVDFIPIRQTYRSVKDIGLHREFLVHFGPRAAACRVGNDGGIEEVLFWVSLVQKQLQRAIDRERIWSRLTTCESIEVLERDLAIFGFFIALGRSTKSFLSANGFEVVNEPIEGFLRYLIGGSVLYYPQLSSISSYQLYVEVVCEEMEWLPFYPGITSTSKRSHGHKSTYEGPPNAEAIPQLLDVCSYWIQSFIKYSKWLENPSNVKAARFLSKGHNKLMECMEELKVRRNEISEGSVEQSVDRIGSGTYSLTRKEPDSSFDKVALRLLYVLCTYRPSQFEWCLVTLALAMESVEEALLRLEELLQELHVSSSISGKEHLKAACTDLERIRRLKKEAEFLEASFRAKADSLQQGDDDTNPPSISEQQQGENGKSSRDVSKRKPRGLWNFLLHIPNRRSGPGSLTADGNDDELFRKSASSMGVEDLQSNEIQRFELLRIELIELEKRVQRSADQAENEEEEVKWKDGSSNYTYEGAQLAPVQKKGNIIEKSFDKLKETSTDVWQGTQLLAIDVAAALGLLKRVLMGDELTDKEKKVLQRTLTDLASVVPIGFLMLLPVTAVGHAAMLAAIQRYVPSLIPSTYGPERLYLLRQLEKLKEVETTEVNPHEDAKEIS